MDRLAKGIEIGKQLLAEASRRARTLEEDLKARREVDVAGMVAGLRARLLDQLPLAALPLDADLQEKAGPLGLGRVRTEAWQTDRLRKVVLSHISLPPMIEGVALSLIPITDLDFPSFAADLMALPWRISVNADVYGRDWQTRDALRPVRTTFFRLGGGPGPQWVGKLGSGQGLHARLRPHQVEEGLAALTQGMATYLGELADAPPGRSIEGQTLVFRAFHQHGPRKRLARLLGEPWAERYSRLLFE